MGKTAFSLVGITQVLLLLIVFILSIMYYSKHWNSNETLRVSTWEATLDACTPRDLLCMQTQQAVVPPMAQRLNCSTSTVRMQEEISLAKAGVQTIDDTKGLNGASTICMLSGVPMVYDHASTETFSSVDVVFLCMSSQVLSAALALVYMSKEINRWYVNLAIGILFVYGMCILFFQNLWLIPMNNIFVVEVLLVTVVLSIGSIYMQTHRHHHTAHQEDPPLSTSMANILRLLEVASSWPLLFVAVLAAVGINTTSILLFTAVSVTLAAIILITCKTEYHHTTTGAQQAEDIDELYTKSLLLVGWKEVVFVMTTWIAALPAIINICIAFYNIKNLSDMGYTPQTWAVAALVLTLAFVLAILTIQSIRFADHDYAIFIMDNTTWVMRYTILLSIFVGALSALDA